MEINAIFSKIPLKMSKGQLEQTCRNSLKRKSNEILREVLEEAFNQSGYLTEDGVVFRLKIGERVIPIAFNSTIKSLDYDVLLKSTELSQKRENELAKVEAKRLKLAKINEGKANEITEIQRIRRLKLIERGDKVGD